MNPGLREKSPFIIEAEGERDLKDENQRHLVSNQNHCDFTRWGRRKSYLFVVRLSAFAAISHNSS